MWGAGVGRGAHRGDEQNRGRQRGYKGVGLYVTYAYLISLNRSVRTSILSTRCGV